MIFLVISTSIVKLTYLYFNCLKLLGLLDSEFLGDRAAEGVGVVLTVYEDVLNLSMHANIRMLYKQRFFTENSSRLTEGFQNASAGKFILQLTMLYPILWFWRFYQKRLVFEINSVWIVAQWWNACVWYWKMSKSIDKHINKCLLNDRAKVQELIDKGIDQKSKEINNAFIK